MEDVDFSTVNNTTESTTQHHSTKTIIYPFDKYEITIQLSSTNEFIGITEVKLNKNFLNYRQKIDISNIQDVEEYYKD